MDLILAIPSQEAIKDVLGSKSKETNKFKLNKETRNFIESLGSRDSIFEFRKTCKEQVSQYQERANKIEAEKRGGSISV